MVIIVILGSTTSMGRAWHSKPELFLLNREKMAIIISKQKSSHYHKRFNTTIPVSKSKKGVVHVTLEIYPYGRDADIETRHATVLAHVSYPLSSRKCQEMAENCNCVVEVKTTFFNVNTHDKLSTKEGKAELSPTSCEACVKINQALSHSDILYSKTNKIQMQVEATLRCQDKIVAVQFDDPDYKDYLLVTTNESQDPLT
jgi:hypothetical protein